MLVLPRRITTRHLAASQSPEHEAGIDRAKRHFAGSDSDVLCGFFVSSVNEWKVKQERVLVLTPSSYYRVAYDHKTGKIDHYHKSPLDDLRVVEKTANGIKVYTRKQVWAPRGPQMSAANLGPACADVWRGAP